MNFNYFVGVLTLASFLTLSGYEESIAIAQEGVKHIAKPGEYIQADYTCRLGDGGLVETTLPYIAGNDQLARSPIFYIHDSYSPYRFVVPEAPGTLQSKPFAPLEDRINVAIAHRINELPIGQSTKLTLQSSVIDNLPPKERYLQLAIKVKLPRTKEIPIQEFEKRYGAAAATPGAKIGADSNFPGIIREVKNDSIIVHYSSREGAKTKLALTSAFVKEFDDENFEAKLDVHEGQLISRLGGMAGRVTAIDDKHVTIDFGQSFAGETLFCEVTTRRYTPGQPEEKPLINWIENFDQGIESAKHQGKPVLLFLYTEECPNCQLMMDKIFPDPSLDFIKNSFVWLKINIGKQAEYADRFGRQGTPMTLVLNADGIELEKLSGPQHVTTLAYKLDTFLAKQKKN